MAQYLFGDTDLAAQRLGVLADVFAASSRAFITAAAKPGAELAVDLGCGPGHTTHLLASVLRCQRAIGLDNSEYFIGFAGKTATENVAFRYHNVTTVPFPVGPCDLIYSRFLLTHQTEPESLLAKWATQLHPDGRLLLEEVDSIHTQTSAFVEYLGVVETMLADGGHELYIGPKLNAIQMPDGLVRCLSRTVRVPVTTRAAARMFSMNIQTWKHNAFVQENYSSAIIRQLEESLLGLAATPSSAQTVEWTLRQLVYEREN